MPALFRNRCPLPALITALFISVVGAPRARAAGPQSVVPAGSAVKGWKQIGSTRLYNPDNLFDLIDGEAEAVKQYAFAACANAEYAPAGQSKPALTMTVFDMTDPLNAFGLFGSDRQSGTPMALGAAEGVRIEPTGLNFWKGRYVIRTTILQPTPTNKAALTAFARAAVARIAGPAQMPPAVQALPPGRQPRSEKYVRKNYAGRSFLTNVITARYPALGMGAEIFIAGYPSGAQAKSALDSFRGALKGGTGLRPLSGLGDVAFTVRDHLIKNVVVAQKGKRLIGALRAADAARAQGLVRQTLAKMK